MDKIFHSTFDFFAHAIPGSCLLAALFVLRTEVDTPAQLLDIADSIQLGSGIFLLVAGYIAGFAIYPLGRALYRSLGFKLWKKKMHHDIPIFISEKYVLIREFSPANFKYVELWNMFCGMSHNLAIASLVLAICCFIKLGQGGLTQAGPWWALGIVAIALTLIFTHRAVVFAIWAADDLNATIKQLELGDPQISRPKQADTPPSA
jgi:hypothetical protein